MNQLTTEQKDRINFLYYGAKYTMPDKKRKCDEEWWDTNHKLILRPLSAISDEDAVEVAKICHAAYPRTGDEFFIERKVNEHNHNGFALLRKRFTHPEWAEMNDPIIMSFGSSREFVRARNGVEYFSSMSESFQYLIQKGYAVPLFIAPNHPDNGKTAIEMGLAIDSTLHPTK